MSEEPMRSVAKGLLLFGFALLLLSLAGCFRSPDAPLWRAAELNWPLDHTGTRTVRLRLTPGYNVGAVADAMEKSVYPKGRPQDPGNVREELLIEALWPDMEPRTARNDHEFQVPGGGRTLLILAKSGAVDPAIHAEDQLHVSLNAAKYVYLSDICVPPANVRNPATCRPVKELIPKEARYGLKHVGIDFTQYPELPKDLYSHHDDIYYVDDLGEHLKTFIECTADEVGPSVDGHAYTPQCSHHFIFEPLNTSVKITYRRVYLQDWQAIQKAVEQLLQSFILAQLSISEGA